jgi:hypothetical protein
VFFIAVAQSAFAVLPQRELAGAVVGRTLSILYVAGLAIAVVLLATSFVISRRPINLFLIWAERFLLVMLGAACGVAQFAIGFMIASVRGQMGGRPIDEVAVDDPLRIQFNNLHQWSEWLLLAGMIAALIVFFIMTTRRFGTAAAATKADPAAPYDFSKEFKI